MCQDKFKESGGISFQNAKSRSSNSKTFNINWCKNLMVLAKRMNICFQARSKSEAKESDFSCYNCTIWQKITMKQRKKLGVSTLNYYLKPKCLKVLDTKTNTQTFQLPSVSNISKPYPDDTTMIYKTLSCILSQATLLNFSWTVKSFDWVTVE